MLGGRVRIFAEEKHMSNIKDLKNTGLKATLPRLKILEKIGRAHV